MDEKKEVSEDSVSETVNEDTSEESILDTESTSGKFWVITLVLVISSTRVGHVSKIN